MRHHRPQLVVVQVAKQPAGDDDADPGRPFREMALRKSSSMSMISGGRHAGGDGDVVDGALDFGGAAW